MKEFVGRFARWSKAFWYEQVSALPFLRFRQVILSFALVYFIGSYHLMREGLTPTGFHVPSGVLGSTYHPIPFPLLPETAFAFVYSVLLLVLLGAVLWPRSRVTAVLSLCMLLYVMDADYIASYTVHKLFLFALLVFSVGPSPSEPGGTIPVWPIRLLQINLWTLYFGNAIDKIFFGDWLDHPELLRVMSDGIYRNDLAAFLLNAFPFSAWVVMQYAALVIEAVIPFCLLFSRTRGLALLLGLVLHGSIALTMSGLWIFGAAVISYYVVFLPDGWFVREWKPRPLTPALAAGFVFLVFAEQPSVAATSPADDIARSLPVSAEFVGVAESLHGSESLGRESTSALLRLVSEGKASSILLEEADSAVEPLRRYVDSDCRESARVILQNSSVRSFWKTESVARFLNNLCKLNSEPQARSVLLFGIDPFDSASLGTFLRTNSRPGDFVHTRCLLDISDPANADAALRSLTDEFVEHASPGARRLDGCLARLSALKKRDQAGWGMAERRSFRHLWFFYQHIRFWQSERRRAFDARDLAMFENAIELSSEHGSGIPIVWGHIAHLMRGPGDPGAQNLGMNTLGALLHHHYANRYWLAAFVSTSESDGWTFTKERLEQLHRSPEPPPDLKERIDAIFVVR